MKKAIDIIIGGDFVPTASNYDLFCAGDVETLFGNGLLDILLASDIRIFNLETPLISELSPIKKCGPNIGIDDKVLKGIKKINPSCLGLANNHIMDHGKKGFYNTINILDENGIDYCGVGDDISHLKKYFVKEVDGFKICIYACAEHEFSIATNTRCGANPFDDLRTYKDLNYLSKHCDFLIVLYHGGKEFYPYPSPNLQKYCHDMIDNGADFVVCQHSHCIGCEESYNDKRIVYGQGNFIFDDGTDTEQWNNGLLINLKVLQSHQIEEISYYVHERDNNCVKLVDFKGGNSILKDFFDRSNEISNSLFIEQKYNDYAVEQMYNVLRKVDYLSGTFLFRIINKITKQKFGRFYFKKIYLRRKSYELQNVIECEAWNDLLRAIVNKYNE